MNRALCLLGPLAVLQMALPVQAQSAMMMVPSCGATGGLVPIHVPRDQGGNKDRACCKVCHIAMRKRLGADSCCGEEDDPDAA